MEIFQDLGNRPIVFIRFNPDKCIGREDCFKLTKQGFLSKNTKEFNYRMNDLKKLINKHIKDIPETEVSVLKLFY
jgi:hypothetical protein